MSIPYGYEYFEGEYPKASILAFIKLVKKLRRLVSASLLTYIEDEIDSGGVKNLSWNEDKERYEFKCGKQIHVELYSVKCFVMRKGIYIKLSYMQAMDESVKFHSGLSIDKLNIAKLFSEVYTFEEFGVRINVKAVGNELHYTPNDQTLKTIISPMSGLRTRDPDLIVLEILSLHRKFNAAKDVDDKKTKTHLRVFQNYISTSNRSVKSIYISKLNARCSFIINYVEYEITAEEPANAVNEVASDADKSESAWEDSYSSSD